MAYRKIKKTDIVGKTVSSFSNTAVNVLRLHFTDGTKVELWADDAIHTSFGNIPGVFVEDNK